MHKNPFWYLCCCPRSCGRIRSSIGSKVSCQKKWLLMIELLSYTTCLFAVANLRGETCNILLFWLPKETRSSIRKADSIGPWTGSASNSTISSGSASLTPEPWQHWPSSGNQYQLVTTARLALTRTWGKQKGWLYSRVNKKKTNKPPKLTYTFFHYLCTPQGYSNWQVPLPHDGDQRLRWIRDRGQLLGARPGRHHPQLHQEGRCRAFPKITNGNKVQWPKLLPWDI